MSKQKPSVLCFDVLVGFSPTHPLQANTKNASMWTCFGVGLLFTSRKPKARPWGRVSGFRRLPSRSPPSQHQKHVHMDEFLVSACSPPLKNQKHAHGGVFLVFGGFLSHLLQADTSRKPKARPWRRVSGFRQLPSPSPPCQHQKRVHGDAFLVLAGSPPLENQKHTPMAVFLAFSGSPPPLKPFPHLVIGLGNPGVGWGLPEPVSGKTPHPL